MKVSIQVFGSLGDVMPYIATAKALQAAGADVSIFAPRDYSQMIVRAGINADPAPSFSIKDWLAEAERRGTLAHPLNLWRDWREMITPHVDDAMRGALMAARGADIVLANLICAPARIAAEAEGCALVLSAQQPLLSTTREVPCAMVWRPWMGRGLNRMSYHVLSLSQRIIGQNLARHRRALNLPNRPLLSDMRTHLGQPLLKATSIPAPLLTGRPAGWTQDDHLLAYPSLLPATGPLPDDLRAFLADGPAPVFFGLGSLSGAHGGALIPAALEALKTLKQRAIFAADLAYADDARAAGHYLTGHVPHDLLFPHCAAVLHHGGAGTTDTCLRAGVPQIIQPHLLDQFWYSAALQRLGVAGPRLPAHALSQASLIGALTEALTPERRAAAKAAQAKALAAHGAAGLADLTQTAALNFAAKRR